MSLLQCLLLVHGNNILFFLTFGSGQEVGGDAVAPPQLTRDAPVLDFLKPCPVSVLVLGGIELEFVVHDARQGDVGKVPHLQEPLHAQARLYSRVAIALAVAHLVLVVLDTLHQTRILQVLDDHLAAFHAVHADVQRRLLADGGIGIENVDGLQIMCLTQNVVVGVMGGSHLQATSTELNFHIAVLNHVDHAANQRHDDLAALEPLVLGILGIDAHGGIAHDGLGASGGDYGIVALLILVDDVALGTQLLLVLEGLQTVNIISEVIQMALFLVVDNLLITQCGLGLGIPVHHAQATVDVALVIEVHKDLENALAAGFVHGEGGTAPVTGGAQFAQLLQNDAAVLMRPVPSMLEELVAREVTLAYTLLGKALNHLSLSCNRGMVSTRHPKGILALHARTADEDVLNGVVEHVTHVQDARHIGRRDDNAIGFTLVGHALEQVVRFPILIPLVLDLFGVVFRCQCILFLAHFFGYN